MASDEQKVIVQVTCPSCTEMFETEIADHSREQEDALIEATIEACEQILRECSRFNATTRYGYEELRNANAEILALTPASIRQRVKEQGK